MPITGKAHRYTFSAPALTEELLADILSGRATVAPEMDAAIREAEETGTFVCPWCRGENDGIPRVRSCGMGVESVDLLFEILFNPGCRDFCLCQLINLTMQTGDEHRDTIDDMQTYVLPVYRYFRLRFVELARGGEHEADGIVVLQDTDRPERLHPDGYYKLSEYLLKNGTVPQGGGDHLCSVKFKAFVAEYWMRYCFQMHGVYHLFGYNAGETERVAKSERGIEARNRAALKRCMAAGKRSKAKPRMRRTSAPRVLLRVGGHRRVEYELVTVGIEEGAGLARPSKPGRVLRYEQLFGFNAAETDRAARASRYDGKLRVSYSYAVDATGRTLKVETADSLERKGVYMLVRLGKNREACQLSLLYRLGVWWKKSACVQCPFDREAANCTERGVERKKAHPLQVAISLYVEYASMCLNENGLLYVRKSLRTVALRSEQLEALAVFEGMLEAHAHSLFEVKRTFAQKQGDPAKKGQARRSVIRLATGTRGEMRGLFAREAERLALRVKTVNGISYAVFAERRERYPDCEGFLVVAPAEVEQKVAGDFVKFEKHFAHIARRRGILLPELPGKALVEGRAPQPDLFALAA